MNTHSPFREVVIILVMLIGFPVLGVFCHMVVYHQLLRRIRGWSWDETRFHVRRSYFLSFLYAPLVSALRLLEAVLARFDLSVYALLARIARALKRRRCETISADPTPRDAD